MEEKKSLLYQKIMRWRPLLDKVVVRESTCQLREEDKEPAQEHGASGREILRPEGRSSSGNCSRAVLDSM